MSPGSSAWIVLGMHRSGTSILTQCLTALGGDPGPPDQLWGPEADNPEGFFEPREMVAVNDALLGRSGGDWLDPPRHGGPAWPEQGRDGLRRRAKAFLSKRFSGRPVQLFKEPRLCLTFGFWRPLLPKPRAVLCLRRPSAVAASLLRRNDLPEQYGRWLWAFYLSSALKAAGPSLAGAVFYEDLVRDPVKALGPLARALDVEAAWADPRLQRRLRAMVKKGLDHSGAGTAGSLDEAYGALRKGRHDLARLVQGLRAMTAPLVAAPPDRLDPASKALAALKPEAAHLRGLNRDLAQALKEARGEIEDLHAGPGYLWRNPLRRMARGVRRGAAELKRRLSFRRQP